MAHLQNRKHWNGEWIKMSHENAGRNFLKSKTERERESEREREREGERESETEKFKNQIWLIAIKENKEFSKDKVLVK